eukprot:3544351-Rhodomonas_salina.2
MCIRDRRNTRRPSGVGDTLLSLMSPLVAAKIVSVYSWCWPPRSAPFIRTNSGPVPHRPRSQRAQHSAARSCWHVRGRRGCGAE